MIFETLFLIGFLGFIAMAAMGALHGHGHSHDHDAGHVAHGPHTDAGHHTPHLHHGDLHHGAAHGHGHGHHDDALGMKVLKGLPMLLSPMNLFSLAMGTGAGGLLLRKVIPGPFLWLAAIAVGLIFTWAMVRPLVQLIMGFASKPSEGLEGELLKRAEAISGFDADGRGLIRINMDGEVRQLLARLDAAELKSGRQIAKGASVYITEIDREKGTCTVISEP